MEIKTLEQTPIEEIVDCLAEAFQNYFLPITDDISYWKNRFTIANADYSQSWGVFANTRLVAFVINCIDEFEGVKTAYNTGTGVLEKYRGNGLVDKLYDFGLPKLKEKKIEHCLLEVINENDRGIHVYERIGFSTVDELRSFRFSIPKQDSKSTIKQIVIDDLITNDNHYSWDFMTSSLLRAENTYSCFEVYQENQVIGFFIINPENGRVAQLESKTNDWTSLFDGISQVCKNISLTNVRSGRKYLLQYLTQMRAKNVVNQYLMKKTI